MDNRLLVVNHTTLMSLQSHKDSLDADSKAQLIKFDKAHAVLPMLMLCPCCEGPAQLAANALQTGRAGSRSWCMILPRR